MVVVPHRNLSLCSFPYNIPFKMTIFTPTRLKKNKTLGEVRTFAKLGPPGLVNQEVGDLKGPPWRTPHGETDPGMTQGW
jgi:hypothetical protein